jgi:hypothetical protein
MQSLIMKCFSIIIFSQTFFASCHRIILHHNSIHHFVSSIKGEEGKLFLHPQIRLIYEIEYMLVEKLWNKARQGKDIESLTVVLKQDEGTNAVTSGIIFVVQDLWQKGIFFMKREKKGRCFFAFGSKTVCTIISRYIKKYITR